jgi:hypothetical protein
VAVPTAPPTTSAPAAPTAPPPSEPLSPSPQAKQVAGLTLTPVLCTLQGVEFLTDRSMKGLGRVQMADDGKLYGIDPDGKLLRFTVTNTPTTCDLALDTSFGEQGRLTVGRELRELSVARGTLYAASGIFDAYRLGPAGQTEATCSQQPRTLVMAPDGSFRLGHFANATLRRITWTATGCTGEDWAAFASPLDNVNTVGFLGPDIAIGGVMREQVGTQNPRIVVVVDRSGREKLRFGSTAEGHSEDHFGWVHDIEACGPRICVLDSNYRRLTLWDRRGQYLGFVSLSEMFDLRYPWIPDFEVVPGAGGYAYFTTSQERGDSDVFETLVYRVAGLL